MAEPKKRVQIDSEELAGRRFPHQEDISVVEDVDLDAATPGGDINWLEDIELLEEDGLPAVSTATELLRQDPLQDPEGARERDRPQGADHAPPVGQLYGRG